MGIFFHHRPFRFTEFDWGWVKAISRLLKCNHPICRGPCMTVVSDTDLGVLGKPLQDLEIQTRIPRPLRLHRGCPPVLPDLLCVVQQRASALRHCVANAASGSLRPSRRDYPSLPADLGCRFRQVPRTLRPQGPPSTTAPKRCLDQSTSREYPNAKRNSLI